MLFLTSTTLSGAPFGYQVPTDRVRSSSAASDLECETTETRKVASAETFPHEVRLRCLCSSTCHMFLNHDTNLVFVSREPVSAESHRDILYYRRGIPAGHKRSSELRTRL